MFASLPSARIVGLALASVLVGVGGAGPADPTTGAIVGRVDVKLPLGPPRERPSIRGSSSLTTTDRGRPDRRQSVVYIAVAQQGAFEASARRRATLDQRQETFVPYVLPITAGTSVDFPNSDPFFHNVFSLSKAKRFDLGRYPKGETKSVRFDEPGVVRVFCEIHSHMSAFVLVFTHRYFDATEPDGSYRIDGVAPGTYDVVVWTDGEDRVRRSVRVNGGETTEVDFVVE
ncbi:MAG TPA: carboxypeptidase regulatory-like domain-containing protein [Vicinamibacteria bacterium]|nr:carboxypeptidase regulatory-like domain-containing protein [Vicinamibacteria bacterium]